MPLKRSSEGFSLIELMILLGICSVVVLGFAQSSRLQTRISRTNDLDKQLDDIRGQFVSWISNQVSCDATFGGLRHGQAAAGIRRSYVGTTDYFVQNGRRIPSTDWAVESLTLLTRPQIAAQYPQFVGGVDPEGNGIAILRVALRQLRRGTVNTLVTATQDTGAFKSIRTEMYFRINAKFGEYRRLSIYGSNGNNLTSATPPSAGGVCCPTCTIPGTAQTYLARVIADTTAYAPNPAPAAGPAANSVYCKSSADPPNPAPSPMVTQLTSGPVQYTDYYGIDCWMYNIDYPILSCTIPNGSAL